MEIERARPIVSGEFTFIGQTRRLRLPLDWRLAGWPEAPALWKFQLHSFEYLPALLAAAEVEDPAAYLDAAWSLVEDWITQNKLGDDGWEQGAWHPYCIARRIVPWLLLAARQQFSSARAGRLIASLAVQLLYLEDNLERDLGGNHLLANLKGLLLGAACLRGAACDRWVRLAGPELMRQVELQLLPHGEHFERSPTYHAIVLEDLLDVELLTRAILPQLSEQLQSPIAGMAEHLEAILHPDGQIPLFGDSAFDAAPDPRVLLDRARVQCGAGFQPARKLSGSSGKSETRLTDGPTVSTRRVGDYWIYRSSDRFLIFDAGPVAPDHLPAHGHADLLTLEASLGQQRLFVDSGTYCYEPGAMRAYCRSTAAHNTLQVDSTDQCEMWSSFRMGRRGHPFGFAVGKHGPLVWACASHDAYGHLGVPQVTRWIGVVAGGGPLVCVDVAAGHGSHRLEERLHFHPSVAADLIASDLVRLRCGTDTLWLNLLGQPSRVRLARGWYCPRFGERQENTVIEWSAVGSGVAAMGWALWFAQAPHEIELEHCDGRIGVNFSAADHEMDFAVFPEPAPGEPQR